MLQRDRIHVHPAGSSILPSLHFLVVAERRRGQGVNGLTRLQLQTRMLFGRLAWRKCGKSLSSWTWAAPTTEKSCMALGVTPTKSATGASIWRIALEQLADLKHWQGDGVLLSFVDRSVVRTACGLGLPIVGIEADTGWNDAASHISYFAGDHRAIGQLGADHLLEQGFQRLAFCGYPPTRMTRWSSERGRAFAARVRERGLSCSLFTGWSATDRRWSELQGRLAAWLKSLEKPVGVMAANDARARHVLEACRLIGARVPEDVAVLGVDNDEVVCELTSPPLSSIEQSARSVGFQAAALLDRLMAGKRSQTIPHLIAPEGVVVRRSTNVVAVNDAEVAAALVFIREHACEAIRVTDVVASVQVSRSTLEARFRMAMGRTIHSEIQRVQIEQARRLIVSTDLPLKQIAATVGFVHVHYMSTVFRRHTGRTPAEYRKHARL